MANIPGVVAKEIDNSFVTPPANPTGVPAAVIGTAEEGPAFVPVRLYSMNDYRNIFGELDSIKFGPLAVNQWFDAKLQNQTAIYLRVLGVGDGKTRNDDNSVTRAGFVVGNQQIQAAGDLGSNYYANSTVTTNLATTDNGAPALGRTFFLGGFMSESAGSTYFDDAGITQPIDTATGIDTNKASILRGVLLIASGVRPALSGWGGYGLAQGSSNLSASEVAYDRFDTGIDAGHHVGCLSNDNNETFVMFMNGLNSNAYGDSSTYMAPRVLTASMNPTSEMYIADVLNTNPADFESKGHLLYAHFPVAPKYATMTGSYFVGATDLEIAATNAGDVWTNSLWLVSGSGTRATQDAGTYKPDYESFKDRFRYAESPWIISQTVGGAVNNLFKFHSLDAGSSGNSKWQIAIENIKQGPRDGDYGSFTVSLYDYRRIDSRKSRSGERPYRKWTNLNLNPSSDNFIAKRIGDINVFFDFDKEEAAQKLVVDGTYNPKRSDGTPDPNNEIRVELHIDVRDGKVDASLLPFGFRGHYHLVTSGTYEMISPLTGASGETFGIGQWGHTGPDRKIMGVDEKDAPMGMVTPPVPFRKDLKATSAKIEDYHWGVQFNVPNSSTVINQISDAGGADYGGANFGVNYNDLLIELSKYFPRYEGSYPAWVGDNAGTANTTAGSVLDADIFNRGKFTLENIKIRKVNDATSGSDNNKIDFTDASDLGSTNGDPTGWFDARYIRSGSGTTEPWERYLQVSDLDKGTSGQGMSGNKNSRYAKFVTFMQGGYDGADVFNSDSKNFLDASAFREYQNQSNLGGTSGPTVAAYRKGIDVLSEKSDTDIQLLVTPGMRTALITDYAITKTEERFDALYLMDVELADADGTADANVITGSLAEYSAADNYLNVQYTADRFATRALNTSFAAAFFPNIILGNIANLRTGQSFNVTVPPTVAALGNIAKNDKLGNSWNAPAGFNRGTVDNASGLEFQVYRSDVSKLYSVDINPYVEASDPVTGNGTFALFGQKTLLRAQTSLDRISVRRLLIDLRRQVRDIARTFLFEPNRQSTLDAFKSRVEPILQRVKAGGGLKRYRVTIDTTTTTQADIENNTIRGKIFLQPTLTAETISLDFVVGNEI